MMTIEQMFIFIKRAKLDQLTRAQQMISDEITRRNKNRGIESTMRGLK